MPRAQTIKIHPDRPQPYQIGKVANILRDGGVALLPTDTVYTLACLPGERESVERMCQIKRLSTLNYLTLLCRTLSEASTYALIDDDVFRLMKQLTPGPYTFLLNATKAVPKATLNPKRKQVGLRLPAQATLQALLGDLDGVLVATSVRMPDGSTPTYHYELFEAMEPLVDVIVDDEADMLTESPSTMLDLTDNQCEIVREGQGLDALKSLLG